MTVSLTVPADVGEVPREKLVVEGGGHGAGGVEQLEPVAADPLLAARDARLVAGGGALCTAERVDDRALARVGNAAHHQPRGTGDAFLRVPLQFFL